MCVSRPFHSTTAAERFFNLKDSLKWQFVIKGADIKGSLSLSSLLPSHHLNTQKPSHKKKKKNYLFFIEKLILLRKEKSSFVCVT